MAQHEIKCQFYISTPGNQISQDMKTWKQIYIDSDLFILIIIIQEDLVIWYTGKFLLISYIYIRIYFDLTNWTFQDHKSKYTCGRAP